MQTALIECQETRSVYSGLSLTSFLGIYWSLLWLSFPIRKWSEGKYTHNIVYRSIYIYTVQFSCSVISDYLLPHGLQHARLPCTSPTPRVYPNSCPLSQWCHPTISSSVVTFNVSQHQGLFQRVGTWHQVAKVLEPQLQLWSFQWIFRTDFFYDWLVWTPCSPRDSQKSSPTPQFKNINSSLLSFLYGSVLTSTHDYRTHLCWQSNVSAF